MELNEVAAVLVMSIALTLSPVTIFFYPYWLEVKGEVLSEWRELGIKFLGFVVLIIGFIIARLIA